MSPQSESERRRRFYVPHLGGGDEGKESASLRVELPEDESHHALKVLRLEVGDEVELFDGAGTVARGKIATAGRRSVAVEVGELNRESRPRPRVQLAFAVPKSKRLDWLLEKSGELGAAGVRAVRFERSVAGNSAFNDAKRQRWQRQLVSAGKQSGRNHLPEILPPLGLAEFLTEHREALRLLGDTGPQSTPIADVRERLRPETIILVGPEGGLTEEEFEQCTGAGFLPVHLGCGTLRTETAAVALLAAVLALAIGQ